MARACAAQTKATFLKLAGTSLVQMFIGDGAKLVRDAFELAKEKQPTIIFIDELDAVGTKRGSGEGETLKFTVLCLSSSTSWTVSPRTKTSRSSLPLTGPTLWTLLSSVQDVSIVKLSSLFLTKSPVLASCRFTAEK